MSRLESLRCIKAGIDSIVLRNPALYLHPRRTLHLNSKVLGGASEDQGHFHHNQSENLSDEKSRYNIQLNENNPRGTPNKTRRLHYRNLSKEELLRQKELLAASLREDIDCDNPGYFKHESDSKSKQYRRNHGNDTSVESEFGKRHRRKHGKEASVESTFKYEQENAEDGERFGSLAVKDIPGVISENSFSHDMAAGEEDDLIDDEQPFRPLRTYGRKTQIYYTNLITRLANEGKVYEAIEVLEERMLKRDRVLPDSTCFGALITALGKLGYTYKAFKLFNRMRKLNLKPSRMTYTSLFNACSNSPWKEDGLRRARKLMDYMIDKEIQPNTVTYAAMIKAFGMCGDILTAFSVVDAMDKIHELDSHTFNALLVCCISDKEAGLKHAIEVWRRMRKRNVNFTTRTYNLLLKAVLECGVGDPKYANTLISSGDVQQEEQITDGEGKRKKKIKEKKDEPTIPWYKYEYDLPKPEVKGQGLPHTGQHMLSIAAQEIVDANEETEYGYDNGQSLGSLEASQSDNQANMASLMRANQIPINILNPKQRRKHGTLNQLSLGDLSKATDRLYLLGGMPGFLSHMVKDSCKPNIKTFMQMLEMVHQTGEAEKNILAVMKEHEVEPDTDFINMMINRRARRRDYDGAKDLLTLMSVSGLSPNIMTYACLAMGCNKKYQGMQLLKDMESIDIVPNIVVYTTLVQRSYLDFSYKTEILKSMRRNEIKPEKKILTVLENQFEKANRLTVAREKGLKVAYGFKSKEFIDGLRTFRIYYATWLKEMEVNIETHPWQPFREQHPMETTDR